MKRIKKAVATTGKYTDRNGSEKNRYVNVGSMFKREDGSVCLKLDSVPVGPGFEGWINFYDLDEERQQEPRRQPEPEPPQKKQPDPVESDDIPF